MHHAQRPPPPPPPHTHTSLFWPTAIPRSSHLLACISCGWWRPALSHHPCTPPPPPPPTPVSFFFFFIRDRIDQIIFLDFLFFYFFATPFDLSQCFPSCLLSRASWQQTCRTSPPPHPPSFRPFATLFRKTIFPQGTYIIPPRPHPFQHLVSHGSLQ